MESSLFVMCMASFAAVFLVAYLLPLANPKVNDAILEAFKLLQWYARNHTLACVVPALFIAGGIITFLSPESVTRYLGPGGGVFTWPSTIPSHDIDNFALSNTPISSPIPEPSSMALMVSCMAGLLAYAWRKQK